MYCAEKVDEELAQQQAQELIEDKDNFIPILTKASRRQIKVTTKTKVLAVPLFYSHNPSRTLVKVEKLTLRYNVIMATPYHAGRDGKAWPNVSL